MARGISRKRLARVSPRAILVRLLSALLLALAFVVALQVSVAGEFRAQLPRLTLAWTPYDAEARAALAGNLVSMSSRPEAHAAARQLALDSLRRSPLTPVALRAIGMSLASGAGSDRAEAAIVMTAAERLSRRDQQTQIWLIQDHLRREDLRAAMRQMDIALRTSSARRNALFGVLATTSADPRIARELATRMRSRPQWAEPFLSYMIASARYPERTVYFARDHLDASDPQQLKLLEALFEWLSAAREYDLAWEVYTGVALGSRGAGGEVGGVVEGDFEGAGGFLPFAWALTAQGDLWAGRQAAPGDSDENVLAVAAHSGRTGEAARQLLRLEPGDYRISASVGNTPEDPFERQTLGLRCAAGDEQIVLVRVRPDGSGPQRRSVEGRFSVPSSCRFQWLFVAIAGDGPERELTPWIDDIQIRRVPR